MGFLSAFGSGFIGGVNQQIDDKRRQSFLIDQEKAKRVQEAFDQFSEDKVKATVKTRKEQETRDLISGVNLPEVYAPLIDKGFMTFEDAQESFSKLAPDMQKQLKEATVNATPQITSLEDILKGKGINPDGEFAQRFQKQRAVDFKDESLKGSIGGTQIQGVPEGAFESDFITGKMQEIALDLISDASNFPTQTAFEAAQTALDAGNYSQVVGLQVSIPDKSTVVTDKKTGDIFRTDPVDPGKYIDSDGVSKPLTPSMIPLSGVGVNATSVENLATPTLSEQTKLQSVYRGVRELLTNTFVLRNSIKNNESAVGLVGGLLELYNRLGPQFGTDLAFDNQITRSLMLGVKTTALRVVVSNPDRFTELDRIAVEKMFPSSGAFESGPRALTALAVLQSLLFTRLAPIATTLEKDKVSIPIVTPEDIKAFVDVGTMDSDTAEQMLILLFPDQFTSDAAPEAAGKVEELNQSNLATDKKLTVTGLKDSDFQEPGTDVPQPNSDEIEEFKGIARELRALPDAQRRQKIKEISERNFSFFRRFTAWSQNHFTGNTSNAAPRTN